MNGKEKREMKKKYFWSRLVTQIWIKGGACHVRPGCPFDPGLYHRPGPKMTFLSRLFDPGLKNSSLVLDWRSLLEN